jgi:hypothetical protein
MRLQILLNRQSAGEKHGMKKTPVEGSGSNNFFALINKVRVVIIEFK